MFTAQFRSTVDPVFHWLCCSLNLAVHALDLIWHGCRKKQEHSICLLLELAASEGSILTIGNHAVASCALKVFIQMSKHNENVPKTFVSAFVPLLEGSNDMRP